MDVNPIIEVDFEPATQSYYRSDARPAEAEGGFLAAVKWACLGNTQDEDVVPMRRAVLS